VKNQTIHAVIFKDAEGDQWVAVCLELNVVTHGDSEEHAKEMIKEAVELHLEDVDKDELDMVFQPIDGQPRVYEIAINAPSLLHT
jgi:predicted RNase H-like HicB family nuclease